MINASFKFAPARLNSAHVFRFLTFSGTAEKLPGEAEIVSFVVDLQFMSIIISSRDADLRNRNFRPETLNIDALEKKWQCYR